MTTFWSEVQGIMGELFLDTFGRVRGFLVTFLPRLTLALLILGLGWLGALLCRKITVKLTRLLGADVLTEKLGLHRWLMARGVDWPVSRMLGWAVYWLVLLSALSFAFDRLGLTAAEEMIDAAARFVPRLITAIVLLGLGIFLSVPVGEFADRLARVAQLPFHWVVGQCVRMAIIAVAIFNVLDYLKLASPTVLGIAAGVLVGGLLLGFGVFAVFGRELVGSMLARRFLLLELDPGDVIETPLVRGEIVEIGRANTHVRADGQLVLVPNRRLAQEVIRKTGVNEVAADGRNSAGGTSRASPSDAPAGQSGPMQGGAAVDARLQP